MVGPMQPLGPLLVVACYYNQNQGRTWSELLVFLCICQVVFHKTETTPAILSTKGKELQAELGAYSVFKLGLRADRQKNNEEPTPRGCSSGSAGKMGILDVFPELLAPGTAQRLDGCSAVTAWQPETHTSHLLGPRKAADTVAVTEKPKASLIGLPPGATGLCLLHLPL